MRRQILMLVFCSLVASSASLGAFRFSAWSDAVPGTLDTAPAPGTNRARFQWTLQEMTRILGNDPLLPAFHTVGGDFAETATTSADIQAFTPSFSSWFFAPGNHDTSELGVDNTSWDYDNARFIFVNEFRCPAGLCDNSVGRICLHIHEWLAGRLVGTPPVVFVVGHKPLSSLGGTQQERDDFWKLLNDHGVLAFLCGHTHVYNVYSDSTGPTRQINTGSAGQSTSLTFLVFDVGDQAVDVSVYRGQESQAFTGGYSFSLDVPQPIYTAHNPAPADGATGVATTATLSWAPGADAVSHDVYLWADGAVPSCVSPGQTGTTYTPTPALAFETTYHWRIDEHYADTTVVAGPVWSFTTRPAVVIAKANGEVLLAARLLDGTNYLNTTYSDDSYEKTQEVLNVTNKNGYSTLDHTWSFDIAPGTFIEFHVEAHHFPSLDGDDFVLSYSTDGTNYAAMLTITKTADDNGEQVYVLPSSLTGRIYVQARDTNHTKAAQAMDTLLVDSMYIVSSQVPIPEPPQPPVADAGPDQTVTATAGYATVVLDGFGSSDPDGTIVSYDWDFDGDGVTDASGATVEAELPTGSHTVTLVVTDDDGLTDSDDTTIAVLAAGAGMHVAGLDGVVSPRGNSNRWTALATVRIVDQAGSLVFGATVSGTWGEPSGAVVQGVTGSGGTVTLSSGEMRSGTSVTFTVDNVTHDTLPYDPAANVSTTITLMKP